MPTPRSPRPRWRRALHAAALALTVALVGGGSSLAAMAVPAGATAGQETTDPSVAEGPPVSGPQLKIAIDDGATSADAGDTLDYTITVSNLGTERVEGLAISQTLAPGVELRSADADGTAEGDTVRWSVDLEADQTATLHSSVTVNETPADLLRLASVACATEAGGAAPLVCATHSDELPAGAAAAAADAPPGDAAAPVDEAGSSTPIVLIGVVAVVIVAGAAAAVVLARRRTAA